MTDEREGLPSEKNPFPLPSPILASPERNTIQDGNLFGWVYSPMYAAYKVFFELYVDGTLVMERQINGSAGEYAPFNMVSLKSGKARLKAWGKVLSQESDPVEVEFYISNLPYITVPSDDGIIRDQRPLINGLGGGDCSLRVRRSRSVDVLSGSFNAWLNGWAEKLNQNLPYDVQHTICIEQSKPGYITRYGPDWTFLIVQWKAPVITSPAARSFQEMTFTLQGRGGEVGATVKAFTDLSVPPVEVGKSTELTGADWTALVTIAKPGRVGLVVQQFKGPTQESARSAPVVFDIRPPQLTGVTMTMLANNTLEFSGSGYNGAQVEIAINSGPGGQLLGPMTVVNNSWKLLATNWPFGQYSFLATQKVSNDNGGWIESISLPFTYTWEMPKPFEVIYSVGYRPTFSGKGFNGATVELFNPGGASKVAPDVVVANGRWSSQAYEPPWGPTLMGEVHLRQRLGQAISGWVQLPVTIAPLAPVISRMIDNETTPSFEGTCWTGAGTRVNLKFSGDPTVYPAVVVGGTWSYSRPTPFEIDITHTLTATQRAGDQDSPPATWLFSVNRKLPTPVLTAPEYNEEVGRGVLVKGTGGVAGGQVQLRDVQFSGGLGNSEILTMDGDWSVEFKGLQFRLYEIVAVQVMGLRESLPSAKHVFKVVVLPPVIEVPAPGGAIARTAIISGTGMPLALVDIYLEGSDEPLQRDLLVNPEGGWRSNAVTLEIGHNKLRARQTFERESSKDTPYQAFRVVPAAPFIETPVAIGQVGTQVVVSGFGYVGDEVAVAFSDEPGTVLGRRALVRNDRTWSVAVELNRPGGNYSLIAVQSRGEFHSSPSEDRPVVLGSYVPGIDVPAPGRWVSDPVGFAGQGQTGVGVLVSWYNPEQVLAKDIVVTDAGWQSQTSVRLPPGGYWVRFKQVIHREVSWTQSDWAESARFEVVSSQPESKR